MDEELDLHERLWNQFSSLAFLKVSDLSNGYLMRGEGLVSVVVIAPGDQPLLTLGRRSRLPHTIQSSHKFALARFIDPDHGPFTVGQWATDQPGVYFLTGSIPASDPRWQKLNRWVSHGSPHVVPLFLDHADFLHIGRNLEQVAPVEVSRVGARHIKVGNTQSRSWSAELDDPRPDVNEVIQEAEQSGYAVGSLTLVLPGRLHVHIKRTGGASLYSGSLDAFVTFVLNPMARSAGRRIDLLRDRERKINAKPRPHIRLTFDEVVFARHDDTHKVIHALSADQNLVIAVIHGNPYLHVSVADLRDGSNFDVMVTTADQVDLYPGFRASLGALTHLAQTLSERLDAAKIEEAPLRPLVTLDQLVG